MTKKQILEKIIVKLKEVVIKLKALLKKEKPKKPFRHVEEPTYIVIHHGGGDWSFDKVNNHHKNKNGEGLKSELGYYVGYHYWIDFKGNIIQIRKDYEEAAHCVDPNNPHWWNRHSIGICLRGNYNNRKLTDDQKKNLTDLLNRLRKKWNIPISKVKAHRDIKPTSCPGNNVYKWLTSYKERAR